jgi:hypothetical protein
MKQFFESLSLGSEIAIVAICSIVVVGFWCYFFQHWVVWLAAIIIPILLAYCIYWSPVWLGANPSEYSTWSFLGVGIPAFAGIISSLIVILIVRRFCTKPV